MKVQHYLILLFLLLGGQTWAQSDLLIQSADNYEFYVGIDGRKQSEQASASVRLRNFVEGNYFLRIEFTDKKLGLLKQNVVLDKGFCSVYKIVKINDRMVLKSEDRLPISAGGAAALDLAYSKEGVGPATASKAPQGNKGEGKRFGGYEVNNNSTEIDESQYPKTITTIRYKLEDKDEGGQEVVELKEIEIQTIVERGGQKMLRRSKEKREKVTAFTSLPMQPALYDSLFSICFDAENSYEQALSLFQGACLTPNQSSRLLAMLSNDEAAKLPQQAQLRCAYPPNCKFELASLASETDIVQVEQEVVEEAKEEVAVEIEEKPKTAAELKAELKAAKKAEKARKKAEKKAAKEKRKAEKAAAKAAAKEAKRKAKEAKKNK
ncbi:hypothetical protein PPO43_09815 [Saprospira sp. CCB-QB6]|uniref:hypothetical protein n=1 Tax=Saprospira sp. CCB-QB6 TaxID=3023936 RepID=UPI00234B2170|nr:hypothetical protein [Saprospira sp. CCB-QB6]WCL80273.1 hypothetical protein PPO43_09815 [Saprospira sp. CCB-QB6]